ncbi:MAG: hypothetical protein WCK61_05800, partial [Candidatus Omnitrophota bacterium]
MPTLPQIPGARKKGVFLITSESDFKKLDSYLINDTVCISGPLEIALQIAKLIQEKHKVGIKIVSTDISDEILASDIELISSPIQEIVGEGRAEAVKFKDGKAVGACLVLFVEGFVQEDNTGAGMPEALVQLGVKGSQAVLSQTRAALDKAISQIGVDAKIAFAGTNYYFPLINALLNIEIKTLADCDLALKQA